MLFQLATTKFGCTTMFEVGGTTCNNAFQLATQQCCVQVEEKCCPYYRALSMYITPYTHVILSHGCMYILPDNPFRIHKHFDLNEMLNREAAVMILKLVGRKLLVTS